MTMLSSHVDLFLENATINSLDSKFHALAKVSSFTIDSLKYHTLYSCGVAWSLNNGNAIFSYIPIHFCWPPRTPAKPLSSDKGLATVVMSRQDYLMKVMQQLDNQEFCQRLKGNLMDQFAEEVMFFFNSYTCMTDRWIIDEDILNYCTFGHENLELPAFTCTSCRRSIRMEFPGDQ